MTGNSEQAPAPLTRTEQASLAVAGVPASHMSRLPQIRSTRWSITLAVFAILQAITGALLLGWLLTETVRSLLLQQPNLPVIIGLLVLVLIGGTVGTLTVAATVLISNPRLRWITLTVSILLPILIELIDIPIRLFLMLEETIPLLL